MNGIYTILLLVLSNIFMTIAWYGHLKLQQTGVSSHWPLIGVIAFSWAIAFFEYCCQVPRQPYWLYRQRRPLLIGSTQGDTGMRIPHRLRRHCQHSLPG